MKPELLVKKFKRTGGVGKFAMPFNEQPSAARDVMAKVALLDFDETPVIACFFDSDSWVLLTSKRLIQHKSNQVRCLPWSEIADATVDPSLLKTINTTSKAMFTRLEIMTQNGEKIPLDLEAGPPFSGFWNVLKFVARAGEGFKPK